MTELRNAPAVLANLAPLAGMIHIQCGISALKEARGWYSPGEF
jgi:hypothetical protein